MWQPILALIILIVISYILAPFLIRFENYLEEKRKRYIEKLKSEIEK